MLFSATCLARLFTEQGHHSVTGCVSDRCVTSRVGGRRFRLRNRPHGECSRSCRVSWSWAPAPATGASRCPWLSVVVTQPGRVLTVLGVDGGC